MRRSLEKPLVVIVGTTGVGKSKLAVELAQAIKGSIPADKGEHSSRVLLTLDSTASVPIASKSLTWQDARVLNSDAMQVYRGLDIITNKITPAEQEGVEHCLMGFKEPGEQYVVGEFVRDAQELVSIPNADYTPPLI